MVQTIFLQTVGWTILNSIWQMAILWILYQVITGFFRHVNAAGRSTLATTLLITGFIWSLLTFFTLYIGNRSTDTGTALVTLDAENLQYNDWLNALLPYLSVLYLLILTIPLYRFFRNLRFISLIRHHGLSKPSIDIRLYVRNMSERLGIRKHVGVWISAIIQSPVTIGFLKPLILLPVASVNRLSPEQLESIILHELSHIRKNDYLINLIVNIIKTLLYFNPFVKALADIVEEEREKSCDAQVLEFQYDPQEYAAALLTLEKNKDQGPVFFLAAGGKKDQLLNRIENILGINRLTVITLPKMATMLAAVALITASLFLQKKPAEAGAAKTVNALEDQGNFQQLFPAKYTLNIIQQSPERQSEKKVARVPAPVTVSNNSSLNATAEEESSWLQEQPENAYMQVSYTVPQVKVFTSEEEKQLEIALASSKKLIAEAQWKELEHDMADAFSDQEKMLLKKGFQEQFEQYNWQQWENKIRLAYESINWDNVNQLFGKALQQLQLDSLQTSYQSMLADLSKLRKEMVELKITGIPDTNITLSEIDSRKSEVRKQLDRIRDLRKLKVVQL